MWVLLDVRTPLSWPLRKDDIQPLKCSYIFHNNTFFKKINVMRTCGSNSREMRLHNFEGKFMLHFSHLSGIEQLFNIVRRSAFSCRPPFWKTTGLWDCPLICSPPIKTIVSCGSNNWGECHYLISKRKIWKHPPSVSLWRHPVCWKIRVLSETINWSLQFLTAITVLHPNCSVFSTSWNRRASKRS